MRLLRLTAAALIIWTTPLLAVSPRSWTSATAEDFLAGELDQIGLTASGSLVAAPAARRLASVDDPFVLSQTSDERGRRYLGTGNNGRVYRVDGSGAKEIFAASEPEIYAVTWFDGSLWAASSPWGGVHRIDPSSGRSELVWKSDSAYIWALAPDSQGRLLVATGLEGAVHRIDRRGAVTRLWKAPEAHIRTLAVLPDGGFLAGGSGEGRIYRVSAGGAGTALFDSPHSEITSIVWDSDAGRGWASAAAGLLPPTPPQRTESRQQNTSSGSTSSSSESEQQQGSVSVDVSFPSDDPNQRQPTQQQNVTGASELYRIDADGFVELVRKFEREIIYALQPSEGGVLVGTGPNGRIYEAGDQSLTLIGSVREKQVVSLDRSGSGFTATTTNSGAVFSLLPQTASPEGTWTSPVRDAAIFSRWGSWTLSGRRLSSENVRVSFRSGNSSSPDDTWSDWTEAAGTEGSVSAPAARYLQYRVKLVQPQQGSQIDRVTVNYLQRNVAPVIESVTVHEPGVVFLTGNFPASGQVVEATNPDEHGIFTSLEPARERSSDPGKRAFRRGYRTVAWKARDDNGDTLSYTVEFRPARGSESWLRLRENIQETQLNFDSSQLPDGEYELRVTADDRRDNPEDRRSTTREGAWFLVDNALPRISHELKGGKMTIVVRDDASPITRVEMAVDAKEWVRLFPDDGIPDAREERFTIDAPPSGSFVMVRAVDGQFNVATARLQAP